MNHRRRHRFPAHRCSELSYGGDDEHSMLAHGAAIAGPRASIYEQATALAMAGKSGTSRLENDRRRCRGSNSGTYSYGPKDVSAS